MLLLILRKTTGAAVIVLLASASMMLPAYAATVFDTAPVPVKATTTPMSTLTSPAAGGVREVFEINDQIAQKQKQLQELRARIERYRKSITDAQAKSRTLRSQLAVVEDRITRQQLALEATATEREQVELEIAATKLDLTHLQGRLERQRALLRELLTDLAMTERQSSVHILLANGSLGSYLAYRDRLAMVQQELRATMASLREDRDALSAREQELSTRQETLRLLMERLEGEREAFREEQEHKQRLLATTQQNESKYQQMLAELRSEQGQIDADIVALDQKVRERLAAIDKDFGRIGRVALSWPVPNRGITAYFHDPEYPFRNVFEHPAIDIRASQGSPIAAAAPGYVARAKDAGYGYSYIMLIHPGGYATVYGHVSQINVREDTYVTRGQVIGLTGGKPGTRGAGRLTTGAHLHLEVRLNGIPVNPMNYII